MAQKTEISIEAGAANNAKPNPPSPKSRLAMLKRTKKTSNASSDPFRFQNNGISYKGKLIGEQDVEKARGDAMCAEAMRNAKGMVKAAGAHKTRISLQINIEGIKILDEKSGAVLHNFPVSRISFIARDATDARAFGLVYGEPGGKYKFYGIKTAQAADQAVLAIRDMFQVVFEMKKKQIEQVKQQQQQQSGGTEASPAKEGGVAVADLLDLETELQQIEQGVQQLANVPTSTDAFGATPFGDPFADSFNTTGNTTANTSAMNQSNVSNGSALNQSAFASPFGNSPPAQQGFATAPQWPQTSMMMPPQQPAVFGTAWGAQTAPALPLSAPIHHAQSTPAFNSNAFSNTNPFASAAFGGLPMTMPAAQPDPFSVHVAAPQQITTTVDWNSSANENQAPAANQPSLHHASTFANFTDTKTNGWEEKRVTSLEEAFTKLVDMDALIGSNTNQETKKNPFEHILNPPKASLNSLSSTCSAAVQQQKVVVASDPFGDDPFFR
ncbi:unnamed protein product [Caenorhabditis bovis]|uniref:PID domain-containing protein n=1 Tax=Caenorhabditis bovis TaxID=2654633 RepID=A0A8S1EWT5_9PELO|nr:unnamed protein product [Caenorhabditis bovis]